MPGFGHRQPHQVDQFKVVRAKALGVLQIALVGFRGISRGAAGGNESNPARAGKQLHGRFQGALDIIVHNESGDIGLSAEFICQGLPVSNGNDWHPRPRRNPRLQSEVN